VAIAELSLSTARLSGLSLGMAMTTIFVPDKALLASTVAVPDDGPTNSFLNRWAPLILALPRSSKIPTRTAVFHSAG